MSYPDRIIDAFDVLDMSEGHLADYIDGRLLGLDLNPSLVEGEAPCTFIEACIDTLDVDADYMEGFLGKVLRFSAQKLRMVLVDAEVFFSQGENAANLDYLRGVLKISNAAMSASGPEEGNCCRNDRRDLLGCLGDVSVLMIGAGKKCGSYEGLPLVEALTGLAAEDMKVNDFWQSVIGSFSRIGTAPELRAIAYLGMIRNNPLESAKFLRGILYDAAISEHLPELICNLAARHPDIEQLAQDALSLQDDLRDNVGEALMMGTNLDRTTGAFVGVFPRPQRAVEMLKIMEDNGLRYSLDPSRPRVSAGKTLLRCYPSFFC